MGRKQVTFLGLFAGLNKGQSKDSYKIIYSCKIMISEANQTLHAKIPSPQCNLARKQEERSTDFKEELLTELIQTSSGHLLLSKPPDLWEEK